MLSLLRSRLTLLAEKLPENLQPMAQHSLSALFESGMNFTDDAVRPARRHDGLPGAVSGSALTVGTGVLSAFMISLRLPKMQKWLAQRFPGRREAPAAADPDPQRRWGLAPGAIGAAASDISHRQRRTTDFTDSLCPSVAGGRGAGGCPAGAGVRHVLLPWALISLLQGQLPRALGLLATYACAALTRSTPGTPAGGPPPGAGPLVTLACLYLGYRLWGFGGMILSPHAGEHRHGTGPKLKIYDFPIVHPPAFCYN